MKMMKRKKKGNVFFRSRKTNSCAPVILLQDRTPGVCYGENGVLQDRDDRATVELRPRNLSKYQRHNDEARSLVSALEDLGLSSMSKETKQNDTSQSICLPLQFQSRHDVVLYAKSVSDGIRENLPTSVDPRNLSTFWQTEADSTVEGDTSNFNEGSVHIAVGNAASDTDTAKDDSDVKVLSGSRNADALDHTISNSDVFHFVKSFSDEMRENLPTVEVLRSLTTCWQAEKDSTVRDTFTLDHNNLIPAARNVTSYAAPSSDGSKLIPSPRSTNTDSVDTNSNSALHSVKSVSGGMHENLPTIVVPCSLPTFRPSKEDSTVRDISYIDNDNLTVALNIASTTAPSSDDSKLISLPRSMSTGTMDTNANRDVFRFATAVSDGIRENLPTIRYPFNLSTLWHSKEDTTVRDTSSLDSDKSSIAAKNETSDTAPSRDDSRLLPSSGSMNTRTPDPYANLSGVEGSVVSNGNIPSSVHPDVCPHCQCKALPTQVIALDRQKADCLQDYSSIGSEVENSSLVQQPKDQEIQFRSNNAILCFSPLDGDDDISIERFAGALTCYHPL